MHFLKQSHCLLCSSSVFPFFPQLSSLRTLGIHKSEVKLEELNEDEAREETQKGEWSRNRKQLNGKTKISYFQMEQALESGKLWPSEPNASKTHLHIINKLFALK